MECPFLSAFSIGKWKGFYMPTPNTPELNTQIPINECMLRKQAIKPAGEERHKVTGCGLTVPS